jgi:hypothetical protein
MADIRDALRELRLTLLSIKFFDVALGSLIVIALGLIVTTYFRFPWWYAMVPWFVYFFITVWRKVNVTSYHEVEDKVPQLREALTTAADTAGKEGVLIKELQAEVLRKMTAIKTSYFMGFGRTTRQLLILTGLSFIIIGLSAFNVNITSTAEFANKQPFVQNALNLLGATGNASNETAVNAALGKKKAQGLLKYVRLQNNGSMFGDPFDVTLGDENIELQVDPVNTGANLNEVNDPQAKKFREQQAGEIDANAQGACGADCQVPVEDQAIVKTYFEKVNAPS